MLLLKDEIDFFIKSDDKLINDETKQGQIRKSGILNNVRDQYMKRISYFVVFIILFAMGCGKSLFPGSVADVLKSIISTNSKVVAASVFAIDGNNNNLGLVLGVSPSNLVVLTPNGYIHNIDWAGNDYTAMTFGMLYYSGALCSGISYISAPAPNSKGTFVYYDAINSVLVVPNAINANGTAAVASVTPQTYNMPPCQPYVGLPINVIELRQVTRADIGLPDPIIPPIQIVSQ